jgi:dihydroneopterin aldolase
LALIDQDGMAHAFDYDPVMRTLDRLSRDGHFHTQERLMTRIVDACASHVERKKVEAELRKTPVLGSSGHPGVRLTVDEKSLKKLGASKAAA